NSDRPQNEVQEVVFFKGGLRPPKVKPAWMWGAEMGANDKNVAIGNEAVWTNHNDADGDGRVKRLLGMDLVRLGLERGSTAEEALNIITTLLEQHGQGGPCSEDDDDLYYHNSFIIADDQHAWVLETSGKFWVAEKVVTGYRNISNGLTITTKFDKHSKDLHEMTKVIGLWDGEGQFNFSKIFASGGDLMRQDEGERLLREGILNRHFNVKKMMQILRQKENRICRGCDDSFPTQGSQVSRLSPGISVHYFTATPDTAMSFFKPFPLREHYLYKIHRERIIQKNDTVRANEMFHMEQECVADLDERIEKIEAGTSDLCVLDNLMKECVESEVTKYRLD
ncbi:Secernin-2, partial [Operophtera brumata]